jgi:cytochrome c553
MKKFAYACIFALGLSSVVMADEIEKRSKESRIVVGDFMLMLKLELKHAMREGGPGNAVRVCNKKAPQIAAEFSQKYGWRIGRTSLKLRNLNDAPDAWEMKVLREFEKRKAAGEEIKTLEYAEIVTTDGKKQFRYMKAIPTEKVCLTCHGTEIESEEAAALDELYPQDKATGFKESDIRGAFTVTQSM